MEYLCERGADVNRGQRSSSLHYAACFGRPAVAKVSLTEACSEHEPAGMTFLFTVYIVVNYLRSVGHFMIRTFGIKFNESFVVAY